MGSVPSRRGGGGNMLIGKMKSHYAGPVSFSIAKQSDTCSPIVIGAFVFFPTGKNRFATRPLK